MLTFEMFVYLFEEFYRLSVVSILIMMIECKCSLPFQSFYLVLGIWKRH